MTYTIRIEPDDNDKVIIAQRNDNVRTEIVLNVDEIGDFIDDLIYIVSGQINRINSLQNIAESFGYALAMNTTNDIDIAAKELSDIIITHNWR